MSSAEQDLVALADPSDSVGAQGRPSWEAAAAAVLNKARRMGEDENASQAWQHLATQTLDQITITPLGVPDDASAALGAARPARVGAWDVRTPLVGTDPKALNEAALTDLDNGATSLILDLGPDVDLAAVLEGVLLDLAPVTLHRADPARSEELATLLEQVPAGPHPRNNLAADPATVLALGDRATTDATALRQGLVATARRAQALGILGVVVDGTALHDRGASDGQELGWTLAVGVHYLRVLGEAGFNAAEAAALMEFRYAAGDEQFATIAKLRAARHGWARVLEASGVEAAPAMRQHAITSKPMMAQYDPWVNMLRTTVAAFAAGVGGADAVTVLPFDYRAGQADAFARRIARNTSALLIEESHVAAVTDPAGGSYAVERFTDDLAQAAWDELGRIESDGGVGEQAITSLMDRVAEVVARRNAGIADRTRPITGVSEFPNLGEVLPERDPWTPDGIEFYGAPYELMRAEPPAQQVFLATMGSVAAHTARATFATNLFAAGGIEAAPAGASEGVDDVLAAYAGQSVVCLAGTDQAYAEWGADLASALRARGASYVILAGKPGARTLSEVDDSCAMGVDALAFLGRVREELKR